MKFNPITEEEAKEKSNGFLLKPGDCDYEVRQAEDATSSAGNAMIKLTLDVWDGNGKKAVVFDYLLDAIPHKVRHFSYSCGLGDEYENGSLEASDCVGKSGKLKIRIKPARDGYEAKNDVLDYIADESAKQTTSYRKSKARDNGEPEPSKRLLAWKSFCTRTANMEGERRNSAWREALIEVFGHADQSKLTDQDWQRMLAAANRYDPVTGVPIPFRHKEEAEVPFGDEDVFKEDEIPF